MKIEQARQIVAHAVEKTKWRWIQYEHSWKDIDTTFIKHGYEQGGFQFFKFSPLLARADILSTGQLGSILEDYPGRPAYDRSFSGGLTSEFYASLRKGKKGETGRKLYSCIDEFTREKVGSPGRFFWRLIWQMLICCRYLRGNYASSFKYYLIEKFSEFKRMPVADETLLNTSPEEWERFKQTKRPWKELTGIGENVFDFIVGDIKEAHFAQNSFKLDSANQHFLQVTGMARLMPHVERENVVQFIRSLKLPYTLRETNKGIYTYCSKTESHNFGFCRDHHKCNKCEVVDICGRQFRSGVRSNKGKAPERRSKRRVRISRTTSPHDRSAPAPSILVNQIIMIAREMGHQFSYNSSVRWDRNQAQTSIGIPSKSGSKRRIRRGFFWEKPVGNKLEFWLPVEVNLSALSLEFGIEVFKVATTHSTGLKKNSVLAAVSLDRLDFQNPIHRLLLEQIISLNE